VRFWDTSALVPTFLEETTTRQVRHWQAVDPEITTWMMTRIEVASAIARWKRERPELAVLWNRVIRNVHIASSTWIEISDAAVVRRHAERIIMDHPLRAAASEKYLRSSLELLQEIQRTGDIFFPKRWMDATLSGHRSAAAARVVRSFVDRLPRGYPDRLRRVILSSADNLFRAAADPSSTANLPQLLSHDQLLARPVRQNP